jgi:hypothetical protein
MMAGKFILPERTADMLRKVAAIEGIDPDELVYPWCVVAVPREET